MAPSTAAVVAVAAAFVVLVGVRATPETTCRAAAARDRRVDYGFCVSRLSHHRDSPDADAWGLAKVAAEVGVAVAQAAVYDVKAWLAKPPGAGAPADTKTRAALGRCAELYDRAAMAFAEAYDGINRREYAAGEAKAAEAASLARRCDDAFAGARPSRSPLARQGAEFVKIAVVCTAITNLLK
ncbi:hypothetical protein ACP70R_027168 [Stipagrostis hirtigluma subsp. patula]